MQTMTIPLLALHCEAQFVSRGATQEAWPLCLKECVGSADAEASGKF